MKKFFLLNLIVCFLSLTVPSLFENIANAQYSYNTSHDTYPDIHTNGEPRYRMEYATATYHKTDTHPNGTEIWQECNGIAIQDIGFIAITNYQILTAGTNLPVLSFSDFGEPAEAFDCARDIAMADHPGYYAGGLDSSGTAIIASWIDIHNGASEEGSFPPNISTTITENHGAVGFSFTIIQVDTNDPAGTITWTWNVQKGFDGAVVPTKSMNYGRDNDPCGSEDCHQMPAWSISQPYLDLWVNDSPVYYKTSLGQEIPFQVMYKQRDTRPKGEQVPITGWNHNWFSYIRLNMPVTYVVDPNNSSNQFLYTSPTGLSVRQNWILTTNFADWSGILYSTDNSESYFNSNSVTDLQTSQQLIPIFGNGNQNVATAFRLLHGDGSQDIYTTFTNAPQLRYGMTESYGCIYDKSDLLTGMHSVWQPNVSSTGTPHQTWENGDDGSVYSTSSINNNINSVMSQLSPSGTLVGNLAFNAMLTERIDAYGNTIKLTYVGFLLTGITDYDGNTTSLSYDGNGYLQTVSMPYGRSASFNYDSSGNLFSITDAMGMTSYMTYTNSDGGLNKRMITLSTPMYGLTKFAYLDESPYQLVPFPSYYVMNNGQVSLGTNGGMMTAYVGEANVNHAIVVTYPDSSISIDAFITRTNGSKIDKYETPSTSLASAIAAKNLLLDTGGNGEASLQYRNYFKWSRRQTPLLSFIPTTGASLTNLTSHDFLLGKWTHYPVDSYNSLSSVFLLYAEDNSYNELISSSPTFIRTASVDGTNAGTIYWFSYDNQYPEWKVNGETLNTYNSVTDPNGTPLITSRTYGDPQGLLTDVNEPYTKSDGSVDYRDYTITYGRVNNIFPYVSQISTPGNNILKNDIAPVQGNNVDGYPVIQWPVIQWEDSIGNISTSFYNSRHQLTGTTNSAGMISTNYYASDNTLHQTVNKNNNSTNTFCFYGGELAFITTPLKASVGFTFDKLSRPTSVILLNTPDNNVPTSSLYNYYMTEFASGPVLTSTNIYDRIAVTATKDFLGNWSYANYNGFGEMTSTVDKNGYYAFYGYCPCGAIDTITDPIGTITTFQYDNVGNRTKVISGTNILSMVYYDILGRPAGATNDSTGISLTNIFNAQGLVVKALGTGQATLSQANYNSDDSLYYGIGSMGIGVTNVYDALGRILRANSSARTASAAYSGMFKTSDTDANSKTTSYGYNPVGLLSQVTNANNEIQSFNYDFTGNLLSTSNSLNKIFWTYNFLGQQIIETNASGVVIRTNGYNSNGQLVKAWSIEKGLVTFNPDKNGNITNIVYPQSGQVNSTYDKLNRPITVANSLGTVTFTYTNFGAFRGALLTEQGPWNSTVTLGYNKSLFTSITLNQPTGWTNTLTYDSLLRITNVSSPAGSIGLIYNGNGGQVSTIQFPGSIVTNTFNEYGELKNTSLKNNGGTILNSYQYGYDLNGRKTNVVNADGTSVEYSYDDIGQLKAATSYDSGHAQQPYLSYGYGYDSVGNLTNGVNGSTTQTFGYNNLNMLTNSTSPSATYLYDNNGNLTNDGTRTYVYDDLNRLTNVYIPNQWKSEYSYDGLSRLGVRKDYYSTTPPAIQIQTNYTEYDFVNNVSYYTDGCCWNAWIGCQIAIGENPLTITHLGRFFHDGNSQTHRIKLVNYNTSQDVPGSTVTVDMSTGSADQFVYGALTNPIVLSANTMYHLISEEFGDGDSWYSNDTLVNTTPVASVFNSEYYYGGNYYNDSNEGYSYGPVSFKYATVQYTTNNLNSQSNLVNVSTLGTSRCDVQGWDGMQFTVSGTNSLGVTQLGRLNTGVQGAAVAVTVITEGALRNNYTGFLGYRITTTSAAGNFVVSSVGRWFVAGNTGSHLVKVVDAVTGLDVPGTSQYVTMNSTTTESGYNFVDLYAPVTLQINHPYYIVSYETSGGDNWYLDTGTTISTRTVAYCDGEVYTSNNNWVYVPTQNVFGVPNIKYKTQNGDGTHQIILVDSSTSNVLTSATINISGCHDQYAWASLTNPVVLSPNKTYWLLSYELYAGDFWYNSNTIMTANAPITIDGPVTTTPTLSAYYPVSLNNHVYGPVNLTYTNYYGWNKTNEIRYVYLGNRVVQERNTNNVPTATYTILPGIPGPIGRTDNN